MDPISNMLTIIKNGYLARKQFVTAANSRIKIEIAKKLAEAGYIGDVTVSQDKRVIKPSLLRHFNFIAKLWQFRLKKK